MVIRLYPFLNGHWFESLRVRCYCIVPFYERVELEPLDKSPVRAELSSLEILLVEGISDLTKDSISVSLLLSHKKRGRKTNITAGITTIASIVDGRKHMHQLVIAENI